VRSPARASGVLGGSSGVLTAAGRRAHELTFPFIRSPRSPFLAAEPVVPRNSRLYDRRIVEWIYPAEGQHLDIGAKLLDLTVDLSRRRPARLPPISTTASCCASGCGWTAGGVAGRNRAGGRDAASFTTEPDEPTDAVPAGRFRTATAAILHQPAGTGADLVPLRLGPLARLASPSVDQACAGLREDGDHFRAGEAFAYCNIGLIPSGAAPADRPAFLEAK